MEEQEQKNILRLVLTRPALDRLIGGDSELEVELRHAAIKEVLSKHVQTIIYDDTIQNIERLIKDRVAEYVRELVGGRKTGDYYKIILNQAVEDKVKEVVNKTATACVDKLIADKIEKEIPAMIEAHINHEVYDRIRRGVREKMDQIKASLGV